MVKQFDPSLSTELLVNSVKISLFRISGMAAGSFCSLEKSSQSAYVELWGKTYLCNNRFLCMDPNYIPDEESNMVVSAVESRASLGGKRG